MVEMEEGRFIVSGGVTLCTCAQILIESSLDPSFVQSYRAAPSLPLLYDAPHFPREPAVSHPDTALISRACAVV